MQKKIHTKELITLISKSSEGEYLPYEVQDVLELFLQEVEKQVSLGNEVHLKGFGNFLLQYSPEKESMNPRTRERITIKESFTMRYKASRAMQERIRTHTAKLKGRMKALGIEKLDAKP